MRSMDRWSDWPKCGSGVDLKPLFDVIIGFVNCFHTHCSTFNELCELGEDQF